MDLTYAKKYNNSFKYYPYLENIAFRINSRIIQSLLRIFNSSVLILKDTNRQMNLGSKLPITTYPNLLTKRICEQ